MNPHFFLEVVAEDIEEAAQWFEHFDFIAIEHVGSDQQWQEEDFVEFQSREVSELLLDQFDYFFILLFREGKVHFISSDQCLTDEELSSGLQELLLNFNGLLRQIKLILPRVLVEVEEDLEDFQAVELVG